MLRSLVLLVNLIPLAAAAEQQGRPLQLAALPDSETLASELWEKAPNLQPFRERIAAARAEQERSRLLPNPGLDLSWNTIPIGETNPPHLEDPLSSVPNYAVGLSSLVEIGKRGPRQHAAASATASAVEDARAALFDSFFDLRERIAEIAASEIRIASLAELAEDARKLTELQKARADKGDAAQLDVDRSAIEEEKLWASLAGERARLAAGLRECGALVGAPCETFGSSSAAQAWLDQRTNADVALEQRPDLRSLELQKAAAGSELELANARKIPDPTVRFGYVKDQFLVSGNQGNSLFVGVSVPLPFFDHGQPDARLARETISTATRTHDLLLEQAQAQLAQLSEEQRALEERRTRLQQQTLPLARSVVDRLEEIVRRGGAPLQDLLLARRTWGELTLDATEMALSAHQLANAVSRARGEGPQVPPELRAAQ
jgi:cobalt-zinc-cadmium efflux system outer membrane protein